MSIVETIAKKRDGKELAPTEIQGLIDAFMAGEIADYQLSAWLMAVFFRGMTDAETNALTSAMLHSGDVLDLSKVPGVKVDKHSTGGVGDKISICLAPLVAACGVPVPMVSGRGLGHTGGTLDKLEAIPGFSVHLDAKAFAKTVATVGTAMIGQTERIAPADKRIYALRDVTATVECVPLIVASILSKKLAEGIDGLVLDVKVGRGAFMKTESDARVLAEALVRVGTKAGKKVVALLTDMSAPIGRTIGNALETREAIEILHGKGPDDTRALTFALGAEMLVLGKKAKNEADAKEKLEKAVAQGKALTVLRKMIDAQGGDPRVAEEPDRLPKAPVTVDVASDRAGWVTDVDPLELGLSSVALGAGRTRADQAVFADVGLELFVARGTRVKKGSPLARIHARTKQAAKAVETRVKKAFTLADATFPPPPMIIDRVGLSDPMSEAAEEKPQSTFYFALVAALALVAFAVLPRLSIGKHALVGKAAPGFSLEVVHNGTDGARLDLAKLKGQVVLIDFWATWCGPCRAEAPILSRVAERYRDKGLVVVGVDTDDKPGAARAFAAEKKLAYPIVYDDGSDVGRAYGVSSLPTLVLVGKDGNVRVVKSGMVDESSLDAMIAEAL